jgi:hypothetical protein
MASELVGLLRKFEGIKTQAQDILRRFYHLENTRIQVSERDFGHYGRSEIESVEKRNIEEAKMILDEFNRSKYDVEKILEITLPIFPSPSAVDEAKGVLRQVAIECDHIIGALNTIIFPLTPEEVDKLNALRKEAGEVTMELESAYGMNLEEAINECEKGHHLASVLITSRIIRYTLDRIEGKLIEEKINFLRVKGTIEKGREDITASIIKSDKEARDHLSHIINIFPRSSDALALLGDCVKLLKIYAKLKESG